MADKKQQFFKPIFSRRNSEYIAAQIEESIIAKVYKPDDRLPSERDLAVQFNVGRAAVREALRILEGSGFVHVKPGGDGGIFVKELDSSRVMKTVLDLVRIGNISIREITETRIAFETLILESCFDSLTDKDIHELEQNIKRCEELTKKNDPLYGEVRNFHVLLASFCSNRLYRYILSSLVDVSDSYIESLKANDSRVFIRPMDHIGQHKAILKAIKKRDLAESKKLLENHLLSVSQMIKDFLESSFSNQQKNQEWGEREP